MLSENERRRRERERDQRGNQEKASSEEPRNEEEEEEEERGDGRDERERSRAGRGGEEERCRLSQEKGRRDRKPSEGIPFSSSSSSLLLPPPPGLSQGRISSSPSQFASSSSSSSLTISPPPGLGGESQERLSSSSLLDSFSSTTPAVLVRCLCSSLSSTGREFLRQELRTGCMYTSGLWEDNELRSIEEIRDYAKKTSRYLDALASSFPCPSQQVQETMRLLKEAEKKWQTSLLLAIPREDSLFSSLSASSSSRLQKKKKKDSKKEEEEGGSRKREDSAEEQEEEEKEEEEERVW